MPKDGKMDKCVADVAKKELQKKGMTIKKATATAYAVCNKSVKKEPKQNKI